mmetsp:Transcript_27775/g.50651  ORF Transcript_27775/g.50651 Transcript_27775/m.50651 type:complete len:333 (-) Transcript_27775:138-1136(-)
MALHHFLLLLLLLALLVLKQNLPHLGSTLPQRLRCLLARAIISNLEPEPEFFVLLEEPTIHLTNRAYDASGDGRLVILAGLEIGPAVGVDKVAKTAVSGVDIGAAPAAAEDVVAGVEFDAFLGGGHSGLFLARAGGVGRGLGVFFLVVAARGGRRVRIFVPVVANGFLGFNGSQILGIGNEIASLGGGRLLFVVEVIHSTLARHHLSHGLGVHALGSGAVIGEAVVRAHAHTHAHAHAHTHVTTAAAAVGSLAVCTHHIHHILGVIGHVAHHSLILSHEGHGIHHLTAGEGGGGLAIVKVHSVTVGVRAVIGAAIIIHVIVHLFHVERCRER